ncbi:lytic transglycosylase domain-containing protein [Qipengyuania sp.]|uniref:lytic transglycosylase domain-containing protein n=1 Tax=Qipengyuania sp. TaxID=2004515 RepID=UPI0035164464
MILARWALSMGLSCAALTAFPVKADVMEIDVDGARWVAGGGAAPAAIPSEFAPVEPFAEVPPEIFVPEVAVADPQLHAQLVPEGYKAKVAELAVRFDLSPTLIEALVWQESRWRPDAISPVGARGLAQLMPATARDLDVDPADPFANLEGGARYLREQLDRFDGDLEKALAAYNAGPGRVIRAGGIPRIRETQTYVAAIMGRLSDHSRE